MLGDAPPVMPVENMVTVPFGVILAIDSPAVCVVQRLPSGPTVIPSTPKRPLYSVAYGMVVNVAPVKGATALLDDATEIVLLASQFPS